MKSGFHRTILIFALFLLCASLVVFRVITAHPVLTPYTVTRTTSIISEVPEDVGERTDINAATAQELEALPGIGETLAARIVKYREEHGAFHDVTELREVKGVGDKLLERIAPYICV